MRSVGLQMPAESAPLIMPARIFVKRPGCAEKSFDGMCVCDDSMFLIGVYNPIRRPVQNIVLKVRLELLDESPLDHKWRRRVFIMNILVSASSANYGLLQTFFKWHNLMYGKWPKHFFMVMDKWKWGDILYKIKSKRSGLTKKCSQKLNQRKIVPTI